MEKQVLKVCNFAEAHFAVELWLVLALRAVSLMHPIEERDRYVGIEYSTCSIPKSLVTAKTYWFEKSLLSNYNHEIHCIVTRP